MSIAHTPNDWYYQLANIKDCSITRGWPIFPYSFISHHWKIAKTNSTEAVNHDYEVIYRQKGYIYKKLEWLNLPVDLVELPIRSTIGTLGQGSIAKAGWENMKRRTSNLIHPAPAFESYTNAATVQAACVGEFFRLVCQRAAASTNNYQIVLVGHSMGAIVLNKVLTEYRDDWTKKPIIKDIVYMAAADTVNNTVNALVPLIQAYRAKTNGLKFYNLTLNRVADIAELNRYKPYYGVIPNGSLLEWIDQHLETPNTPADRTMGSEVNVLSSLYLFESVKANCKFRAFDRQLGHIPNQHGNFSDCPFWRESFWWSQEAFKDTNATNNYWSNWMDLENSKNGTLN